MLKLLLFFPLFAWLSSIYDVSIPSVDGSTTIQFSAFKGKKILIANTASGSTYAKQYASLEQLALAYPANLVVIAVPSNDFGNEPGTNSTIQSVVQATYGKDFLLASLSSVSGSGQCALFQWLTNSSLNGATNHPVAGDFQKYLVDEQGSLIAHFSAVVDPMDSSVTSAIQGQ